MARGAEIAGERGSPRLLPVLSAGLVIGAVEVVLAVSFASLVYGGYLVNFLADGIGLYLLAGAITLAAMAWTAGRRGVVGSVQDAAAAVLAVVAYNTAIHTFGSPNRAFLTVVAVTVVVTLLTGLTFVLLGVFRIGNLARFVPYPVVGGFLCGTGWLLFKGGVSVAADTAIYLSNLKELVGVLVLERWIPAVVFGVVLLLATRVVRRPLVIPAVLGLGLVVFVGWMLVSGTSLQDARNQLLLLGPFASSRLLHPWTLRAVSGADWSAVVGQSASIATAVFVAVMACLFNVTGVELVLHRDLDSNRELRDAGAANLVSSVFGGIPAYHALSLTSLAEQMGVGARVAGLVAAVVPLAAVIFGSAIIQVIPRFLVGGVLVFVGLSFIVTWMVDLRRSLPLAEYGIVLAIFLTIAAKGLLPGVVVGLILSFATFAITYSRIDLVREVEFGSTYRSNVDRPAEQRAALRDGAERVQILVMAGFVFFGTASGLLDRIRRRIETGQLDFLVLDLRRVTGMDSSAVTALRKVEQLAEANGFEVVVSGASDRVRARLAGGGLVATEGIVRFEPDLDHALERCEDVLLRGTASADGHTLEGMPAGLEPFLERVDLPAGTVLLRQGEAPDALFVVASGRLDAETAMEDGTRMRLSSMGPGVIVGEVAMYLGGPRTADVVAREPSVVLRLSRPSLERLEAEDPALAVRVHRWLATTLAARVSDSIRAYEALMP